MFAQSARAGGGQASCVIAAPCAEAPRSAGADTISGSWWLAPEPLEPLSVSAHYLRHVGREVCERRRGPRRCTGVDDRQGCSPRSGGSRRDHRGVPGQSRPGDWPLVRDALKLLLGSSFGGKASRGSSCRRRSFRGWTGSTSHRRWVFRRCPCGSGRSPCRAAHRSVSMHRRHVSVVGGWFGP